jgi:hypothetical protein
MELYTKAQEVFQKIQNQQIQKGLEKYNTPLKSENHTIEELVLHALEENIDQLHYLVAILEKVQDKKKVIPRLSPFEELDMMAQSHKKPPYADLDD